MDNPLSSSPWPRFGAELRKWRESRNLLIADLARMIPLHDAVISRWENGRRPVPAAQIQRLDDALSADGYLVVLHAMTAEAAELRRTVEKRATSLPDEASLERRTAMQLIAGLGSGAAVPPDVLESVLSGVENALGDHTDVDDWEHAVADYGHQITRQAPGSLVSDLTADIVAVGHLLSRRYPPLMQAGLLRVSAELSALLAIEFGDMGERRAARTTWETARRAADASGDRDLRVWVYGRSAQDAFWIGRSSRYVTHLIDVAVHIADRTPCVGLARAYAARAYLAVKRGHISEAQCALDDLKRVFDHMPDQPDEETVLAFRHSQLRWSEAYVRTQFGDDRAHATLDQAVSLYPPDAMAPVTNLSLMRALVLIKQREIDAGIDMALATIKNRSDAVAAGTLLLTGQILAALPEKARELPAARELREHLA